MRRLGVRRLAAVAAVTAGAFAPASGSEAATSDDLWASFDEASERHAEAAEELAALELSLEDIDAQLRQHESRVADLEAGVRELAVWVYVRAGVDDDLTALVDPATDAAWAGDYADQAIGAGSDLVTELAAGRADLAAERSERDAQAERLNQTLSELADLRTDLQQRAIAARASEDEAARQAAEAAARAAAEAEAAAAAAEAAAASSTNAPTDTGSPAATPTTGPATAPVATSPPTTTPAPTTPAPASPRPTGGIHSFDGPPTDAQLLVLRRCESGDNYANKRNPRYRGAYQFAWRTWDAVAARQGWHDLVGVDPADAAPASQDAMVRALYATNGWRPWPVCGQRASAA